MITKRRIMCSRWVREEYDEPGHFAAEHGISAHGQLLCYVGETALDNATSFNWGMKVNAMCGPIQSRVYKSLVNESSALPIPRRV